MRKLAILTGAAVLGLGLGAGDASALKLSDICNSTLSENTDVKNPAADYVSGDCVITVPAPFKLEIDGVNFATGNGGDLIIMGTGDAELEIKESEIDVDGRFKIAFVDGNIKIEDNDDGFRVNGKFVIETMLGDIVVENNDIWVYSQDFEIESEGGGDVIVEGNHIEGGGFVEIQTEGDGSVRVAENELTVVGNLVVESAGPGGVTVDENVLDITGCLEIESDAEDGGGTGAAGEVHVKENYVIDIVLGVEIGAKNFNGSRGVCVSEDNFGSTVGGNGVDLNGACFDPEPCLAEVS